MGKEGYVCISWEVLKEIRKTERKWRRRAGAYPYMHLMGMDKKGVVRCIEKVQGEYTGCAWADTVKEKELSRGLYVLLKKGYSLGGVLTVGKYCAPLCSDYHGRMYSFVKNNGLKFLAVGQGAVFSNSVVVKRRGYKDRVRV